MGNLTTRRWVMLILGGMLGLTLIVLSIAVANRLGLSVSFSWLQDVTNLIAATIVAAIITTIAWRVRAVRAVVPLWLLLCITAALATAAIVTLLNQGLPSFGWITNAWTWTTSSWDNFGILSVGVIIAIGTIFGGFDPTWPVRYRNVFFGGLTILVVGVIGKMLLIAIFGDSEVIRLFQIGAANREAALKAANDSGAPLLTLLTAVNWKLVGGVLALLILLWISGKALKLSKTLMVIVGTPAVIGAFSMIYWLAWGIVPQDFKDDAASVIESVVEVTPLIQSETQQQAEADTAAAALLLAAAELEEQQRLRDAALREAKEVKFFDVTDTTYLNAERRGQISDVESVQLQLGGDRHYREASDTWRVAALPKGHVSFEKHDPDGDGEANGYWVTAIVPQAKVTLFNGIKGETFKRFTFE